jgi:hypothetical protein
MSEIKDLGEKGQITETIYFANKQNFSYTIRMIDDAPSISAEFDNQKVIIKVPTTDAKEWINTDRVGLENYQVIEKDVSLNILLEKDFKCLTRRVGESDMFPNPNEAHT